MAIHEVTYYQAKCDHCGTICDDYGEHSALGDPSEAFEGIDWLNVRTTIGHEFHFCNDHTPAGIEWCAACEEELPEDNWGLYSGNLFQICPACKHPNEITLKADPK